MMAMQVKSNALSREIFLDDPHAGGRSSPGELAHLASIQGSRIQSAAESSNPRRSVPLIGSGPWFGEHRTVCAASANAEIGLPRRVSSCGERC